MSVDLLRQQQRWRDALMDIRQMMATLVQEVCTLLSYCLDNGVNSFCMEYFYVTLKYASNYIMKNKSTTCIYVCIRN